MILWLASYPRSGNTLARMILHTGSGLPTYSVHGNGWKSQRVAKLIGHRPLPKPRKGVTCRKKQYVLIGLAHDRKLSIIKTHRRARNVKHHPAIYIIRDGRDVVVSLAHHVCREEKRFEDELARVIQGELGWGLWSDVVLKWRARKAPTAFVRYEDMLETPYAVIQKALDYLKVALRLRPKPLESFESLHDMSPQFFRKGKVGSWRQEMSPELQELFWKLHEGGMRAYGYTKG